MAWPLTNGDFYSFQDISLGPVGPSFVGWKKIDYSDELSRSWVRGTARTPLGLTAGHYTPEMEFEAYLPSRTLLLAAYAITGLFSGGVYRARIDWTVSFGGTGPFGIEIPVMTDVLPQVAIGGIKHGHSEGEEALSFSCKCWVGGVIVWSGIGPGILEPSIAFAIG